MAATATATATATVSKSDNETTDDGYVLASTSNMRKLNMSSRGAAYNEKEIRAILAILAENEKAKRVECTVYIIVILIMVSIYTLIGCMDYPERC